MISTHRCIWAIIWIIWSLPGNVWSCFAPIPEEPSSVDQIVLLAHEQDFALAQHIALHLEVPFESIATHRMKNGDVFIQTTEDLSQKNVLIVQPNLSPHCCISESLIELYLLVREIKNASVASITALVPYQANSKLMHHHISSLSPISSANIALFLEVAGVDRVITMDMHRGHLQGFFRSTPVNQLYAISSFAPYFATKDLHRIVLLASDTLETESISQFAKSLESYSIPIDGICYHEKEYWVDLKDADVILITNICAQAEPLIQLAQQAKQRGAKRVFAVVAHPVLSKGALHKLASSFIEEIIIATPPSSLTEHLPSNIRYVSAPPLLKSQIQRIPAEDSLADLLR